MTLLYSSSMRNLFTRRGLNDGFSSPSVTLYSGTQPTPSTLISSWSSYNSSSSVLLWHAQSGLSLAIAGNGISIYGNTFPAAAAPVRNGTASWGVIWSGSVAYSGMGTTTIPSTNFMIAPVSSTTGNGVIRLQSTTLSTATTATIINLGFTIGLS